MAERNWRTMAASRNAIAANNRRRNFRQMVLLRRNMGNARAAPDRAQALKIHSFCSQTYCRTEIAAAQERK
jgi:hypothetical protein